MKTSGVAAIIVLTLLCSGNVAAISDRGWIDDIRFYAAELKKNHVNPFTVTDEQTFDALIGKLIVAIPHLSETQRMTELLKITASIGDAHTTLDIPRGLILPLGVYAFDEGLTVYSSASAYKELVNGIIIAVNDVPVAHVIERLTVIIPHENDAQLRNTLPSWIIRTEILACAGITDEKKAVKITVRTSNGKTVSRIVTPVSYADIPNVTWAGGLPDEQRKPFYLQNRGKFYWFTVNSSTGIVYFAYNVCKTNEKEPFGPFVTRLFTELDKPSATALVIDLRNNGGGDSSVLDPVIDALQKRHAAGTLPPVYCIIGRRTFSSAVINAIRLQRDLHAVLIGEPTGGKPNHFGEVQTFELPNTRMTVSYSTKYFRLTDYDTASLMPEVPMVLSLKDYINYRDPVWDYIVNKAGK